MLRLQSLQLEDLINRHVRARMRGQWWHGSARWRCRGLARKLRIDLAPTDGKVLGDSLIADLHASELLKSRARRPALMQTHLIRIVVGPDLR